MERLIIFVFGLFIGSSILYCFFESIIKPRWKEEIKEEFEIERRKAENRTNKITELYKEACDTARDNQSRAFQEFYLSLIFLGIVVKVSIDVINAGNLLYLSIISLTSGIVFLLLGISIHKCMCVRSESHSLAKSLEKNMEECGGIHSKKRRGRNRSWIRKISVTCFMKIFVLLISLGWFSIFFNLWRLGHLGELSNVLSWFLTNLG
ncbi:hypothetical protein AKJ37_04960 [candidate division MSBL1 archaeon SCGC-AAA259I09]|uniref:Uncharacterized protein n=2 Tax=candidate division MSBL1 TaxID=215777 RepID=A0A133UQR2_9EURY|nr:hypothetical protein AKJ61_04090 [candidate division MSBL1 archaeon SCGC-AAA259B11]KXA96545.1 hypothetical protein AKJ37_04960 [candidate division MSBL1 archaeon SCGC-AAA259I09]